MSRQELRRDVQRAVRGVADLIEEGLALEPGTAEKICEGLESAVDELVDWECEDHIEVIVNRVIDGKIYATNAQRLNSYGTGFVATSIGPDGTRKSVEIKAMFV